MQGLYYHIDSIKDQTRKSIIDAIILRGDHKPSHSEINSSELYKDISKEVYHGWSLPPTIGSLQNIKNAEFVPLGVAELFSINDNGERCIKICVTLNCLFPGPSGIYVNNQVQRLSLHP